MNGGRYVEPNETAARKKKALPGVDAPNREQGGNNVKRELSLEVIERWLKDSDCVVRRAAMNACQGKDVPLEVIELGLKDNDCDVRRAAMNACQTNGVDLPLIRTVEPPATVYKKCMLGVIVCASIPEDAQVRGSAGCKCRANKAVITKIVGDVCGEPVGISTYDKNTTYFEGDEVFISGFDYSNEECSSGFHFFLTREEAKNYST